LSSQANEHADKEECEVAVGGGAAESI